MKILFIIISAVILSSCTNSTQNDTPLDKKEQGPGSSPNWTDNFTKLKNAIATGDRKEVKSFIDFPIKNEGNEIWYLADSKLVMEIDPKETKPFTESDFDEYFSSIFSLDLRKTLEVLNLEEFFRTNKSTSPDVEVVKGSKSTLGANFDSAKRKITLALATDIAEQGTSKLTIYYQFNVLSDQSIEFGGVHVE
jgi:hypothetical protein